MTTLTAKAFQGRTTKVYGVSWAANERLRLCHYTKSQDGTGLVLFALK
jgi:hypothetical protein